MNNTQITANRIKEMVKHKGSKQSEILEAAKVGKNTISKLSSGTDVLTQTIVKISDVLDCSVDYLLGRTDNPQSHKACSTVSVGDVSGNSNSIIGNGSVGNVTLTANDLDKHQKELIGLYGRLTTIQQAKLLVLVSDVANGKSDL